MYSLLVPRPDCSYCSLIRDDRCLPVVGYSTGSLRSYTSEYQLPQLEVEPTTLLQHHVTAVELFAHMYVTPLVAHDWSYSRSEWARVCCLVRLQVDTGAGVGVLADNGVGWSLFSHVSLSELTIRILTVF